MSFLVRINGQAVNHSGLSCSSVRRGGFESCTFTIPEGSVPRKGSDVRVWDGISTVWHGFVKDAGVIKTIGRPRGANVTAIGYGARCKGNPFSMIFIDRSLTNWTGISRNRRVAFTSLGRVSHDPIIAQDPATGIPCIDTGWDEAGGWALTQKPTAEAVYDAGPGNSIKQLTATWVKGGNVDGSNASWSWQTAVATDADLTASVIASGDLQSVNASGTAHILTGTKDHRFGLLQHSFEAAGGSDSNNRRFSIFWENVVVIGHHGLTPVLGGFYATDIIEYAVKQSDQDFEIVNLGGNGFDYVVRHAVYRDPVESEIIIEDMITLLGWNYGTWEPSPFGTLPKFMYGAPPEKVTCMVAYDDLINPDINDDITEQHNRAMITSRDAAGTVSIATVEKEHPGLPEGWNQTLQLDLGQTSTPEAQGAYLLALDQDSGRASGSTDLPPFVRTPGGRKPSHLLRPGQERLAVLAMPQTDKLFGDSNAIRGDTFSIARLSITEAEDGSVKVNAEVDSGASLTETLTARIDLAHTLAGV